MEPSAYLRDWSALAQGLSVLEWQRLWQALSEDERRDYRAWEHHEGARCRREQRASLDEQRAALLRAPYIPWPDLGGFAVIDGRSGRRVSGPYQRRAAAEIEAALLNRQHAGGRRLR